MHERYFYIYRTHSRPVQKLSRILVQPINKLLSNYFAVAGLYLRSYEGQFLILIDLKKREPASLRQHSETALSN